MAVKPATLLARLEKLKGAYGEGVAADKLGLLAQLARRRLEEPEEIARLHECLCFLRAYPDDADLLAQVEAMLECFDARSDLRRNRRWLQQTGVAGTRIHFSFYWYTARWLARKWPNRLLVDWSFFRDADALEKLLPQLLPYSETPALDMVELSARDWVERLKGREETDAVFLIRRFEALPHSEFGRESLYEEVDIPMTLLPGPTTPSRTRAKIEGAPVHFQTRPLSRKRPSLRREVRRPPVRVRRLAPREADRYLDLTRAAMVTRHRDLHNFSYADRNDARLVDCGDGLQFVGFGMLPERRLMIEGLYSFLTLKNGVPIGYVLTSSLFRSTEIAYNVFETFRGAEAATVFGRVLATARHLFGADGFTIDPYQLGHGNAEGLKSGAWWFYYKLGFRPRDREVRALLKEELARMKRDPKHRSSLATLDTLSSEHLFLQLGPPGQPMLGGLSLGNLGLRISDYLAERFGSARERGLRTCAKEAAALLGLRSMSGFSRHQRLWWERWSPLVLLLPGVRRWTPTHKLDLARVIRAKGGKSELEYVRRFDAHPKLQRAVLELTAD